MQFKLQKGVFPPFGQTAGSQIRPDCILRPAGRLGRYKYYSICLPLLAPLTENRQLFQVRDFAVVNGRSRTARCRRRSPHGAASPAAAGRQEKKQSPEGVLQSEVLPRRPSVAAPHFRIQTEEIRAIEARRQAGRQEEEEGGKDGGRAIKAK